MQLTPKVMLSDAEIIIVCPVEMLSDAQEDPWQQDRGEAAAAALADIVARCGDAFTDAQRVKLAEWAAARARNILGNDWRYMMAGATSKDYYRIRIVSPILLALGGVKHADLLGRLSTESADAEAREVAAVALQRFGCREELHLQERIEAAAELDEPVADGAEAHEVEGHIEAAIENSSAETLQKDAGSAEDNALLMRGVLESKMEIQKKGLPLSFDGVVVLRLTSRARSQEVRDAILNCPFVAPALDHVREAGCSPQPDWSGGRDGPLFLVPLTEEQVDEANIELTCHHIVTPTSLSESIRQALKSIAWKKRPQLCAPEVLSLYKQFRESSPEVPPAGCSSDVLLPNARASDENDEAEEVDAVPECEFGLRTDSNVGFPENPHQLSE